MTKPPPRFLQTRYFSGRVPEIRCAVCEMPVRKVVSERVLRANERGWDLHIAIHCHGSVERLLAAPRAGEA